MSKQTAVPAGERFANDLRRIREARGVTIDQIHDETRVARSLVQTFEKGSLYDHPGFNRVYMRSFIRAYTSCIDVDADEALRALDDALSGDYEHALAAKYLDEAEEHVVEETASSGQDDDGTGGPEAEDAAAGSSEDSESLDTGRSQAPDDGPASRRSDRPMGGRAAAGRNLSSVSAPRPVGTTNGASQPDGGDTADAADESGSPPSARDRQPTERSEADAEVSSPDGPEAPGQSADDRATHAPSDDRPDKPAGDRLAERESDEGPASRRELPGDGRVHDPTGRGWSTEEPDGATDIDPETGVGQPQELTESDDEVSPPESPEDAVTVDADSSRTDETDSESESDVHPLLRDPGDLDAEEDAEPAGPPDRQPHEDPSSDIGPNREDLPEDEVPSWMQGGGSEDFGPGAPGDERSGAEDDSPPRTVSAGTIDDTAPLPDRSAGSDAAATPGVLRTLLRQQTLGVGIGAAVAVLLIGLLVFWGLGDGSGSGDASGGSGEASALTAGASGSSADDTTASVASAGDRPPPANITLGPTLHLTLVAEDDIGGIRIQRDDDLRRPYWIEAGEASVFPFERRIIISDPGEDIDRILVEGFPYPIDRTDAGGRLVLTRDSVQSFADTLRGSPASLSVSSDTVAIPPRSTATEEEEGDSDPDSGSS